MCSRYAFVPEPAAWADFHAVLAEVADELLALPARPKLAPTDVVPIVVQQPGLPPQLISARWGFVPHWWNKPELPRLAFNARSEEAAAKPMWRDALRASRCLIPATHWIEWQHRERARIPHQLRPDGGHGFMFAGLWSLWQKKGSGTFFAPEGKSEPAREENGPDPFLATCAILTTAPSPAVAAVHDRMPVVLAPAAWRAWLDPQTGTAGAQALLREHTVGALRALAVA